MNKYGKRSSFLFQNSWNISHLLFYSQHGARLQEMKCFLPKKTEENLKENSFRNKKCTTPSCWVSRFSLWRDRIGCNGFAMTRGLRFFTGGILDSSWWFSNEYEKSSSKCHYEWQQKYCCHGRWYCRGTGEKSLLIVRCQFHWIIVWKSKCTINLALNYFSVKL